MDNKNNMADRFFSVFPSENSNVVPYHQNDKTQSKSTDKSFTHIEQRSNGLYAIDSHGRSHFLTAMTIESVIHFFPDKLFRMKDFYQINVSKAQEPLLLTSAEYDRNETLMNKLAEASGVGFAQLASPLRMGRLFKAFLSPMVSKQDIKFYYGWERGHEGWIFTLHDGKTHNSTTVSLDNFSESCGLSKKRLVDFQYSNAKSIVSLMESIAAVNKRSLLFLWIHAASLYSLLNELGFPIGVGLCLNSQSPQITICLRELLEWYDDKSIPITETPAKFLSSLTQRKDQPLLISDSIGETKNREILMNCVRERSIPITVKNEEEKFALQALPTIIGNCRSKLCSSAEFILLEINDDDLTDNACNIISERSTHLRFYIEYFLQYIAENIYLLKHSLDEAREQIFSDSSKFSGLTENHLLTICAFHGLEKVIREYHSQIYADDIFASKICQIISDDWSEYLFNLLPDTSSHENEYGNIVNVFSQTLKDNIKAGKFDIRKRTDPKNGTACTQDKSGIIYLFDGYICLTRSAYLHVQKSCSIQPHALLNALRETGTLIDSNYNTTTDITRLKVYSPDGTSMEESFYQLVASKLGFSLKRGTNASANQLPAFTLQLGLSENSTPILFNGGNNNHIFISGGSGSGKSTKIKELAAQLPSENVRCIIFDCSGDYTSDFDYRPNNWPAENTTFFNVKHSSFSVLPFCKLSERESSELQISRLLDCLASVFTIGSRQRAVLEGAISHYLQTTKSPSLNDFLPTTIEDSKLNTVLDEKIIINIKNLCGYLPDNSNIFDWELNSPGITIVDLHQDFGKNQQATIIQLLTGLILNMRQNQPRQAFSPVVLVYDECQHLDMGSQTQIGTLLREGRKWGFSGWFSTQWIGRNSIRQALGDVSTRLYFQPNREHLSEVVQDLCDFNSDTKQANRSMLSKLQVGQFICVTNNTVTLSQAPQINMSDYSIEDIIF